MGTRKSYTREFKLEAVRLATQPGASVKGTAEYLGINASMLQTWKRELTVNAEQAFPLRAEHLDLADGIEPVARRDVSGDELDDSLGRALGLLVLDEEEVLALVRLERKVPGVPSLEVGCTIDSRGMTRSLSSKFSKKLTPELVAFCCGQTFVVGHVFILRSSRAGDHVAGRVGQ